VFEKRNNLYFYPTYYEGFECSKNVVYTGAVPNQQLSNFIPGSSRPRQEEILHRRFPTTSTRARWPRFQDPDREERRRMDRRRISRTRAFGMGLDVNKIKSSAVMSLLSNVDGATPSSPLP